MKAAQISGKIARRRPGALVLGADQVLDLDGAILDKPADRAAALDHLWRLSGRRHRLVSAAVLMQDGQTDLGLQRLRRPGRPAADGPVHSRLSRRRRRRCPGLGRRLPARRPRRPPVRVGRRRLLHHSRPAPAAPARIPARLPGARTMTDLPTGPSGPSGRAIVAGVAGWPVGHSRSPRLHGHWLRRYGIDGLYAPFPIALDDFETAVRGLAAAGLAGLNVTVPHKAAACALSDRLDDTAQRLGAANTLGLQAGRRHRGPQHRRVRFRRKSPGQRDRGRRRDRRRPRRRRRGPGGRAGAAIPGLRPDPPDKPHRSARRSARRFARTRKSSWCRGPGGPMRWPMPPCWSTRRRSAWRASPPSTWRSTTCRPARRSPTSSMRRSKRRCSPRPGGAAAGRSTASACCCIRAGPASTPGSASIRRSTTELRRAVAGDLLADG